MPRVKENNQSSETEIKNLLISIVLPDAVVQVFKIIYCLYDLFFFNRNYYISKYRFTALDIRRYADCI